MHRPILLILAGLGNLVPVTAAQGVFNPDVQGTGATMAAYMIPVTGGGQPGGPQYTFEAGRFEITNQQLCDFLNDAQRDANSGTPTRRSSNMFFGDWGTVHMDSLAAANEILFQISTGQASHDIAYDAAARPGSRYRPKPGLQKHPARHLSWSGALKFCNWLSIDQGLSEQDCCYAEGPHVGDWHAVTITTADWWGKTPVHNDYVSAGRDLNDSERLTLVRNHRGYRLLMDDAGFLAGLNRPYPRFFNEWLKAAAWDPAAPNTTRTNAGGWTAQPYHWMYGTGRETNGPPDANYYGSGDPWDNGTVPVDYYDGTDHGGTFATADTSNRYGFYGMAGNVWDVCQDYGVSLSHRSVRGGSWVSTRERQAAASCYANAYVFLPDTSFGIRVARVPGPVENKLAASDPQAGDEFARTVCIGGDYAISGSHFDDDAGSDSGSAYVYRRDVTGWVQESKVIGTGVQAGDRFGFSVGIDGDTAIAGALYDDDSGADAGAAYVFKRGTDGTWSQEARLDPSDPAAGDWFGYSVALHGDYAIVGARRKDVAGPSSGCAYVFKRTGGTWAQDARLTASDAEAGDYFGHAVAVGDGYAVVGAHGEDQAASNAGAVYVFKYDGANWAQQQKLVASDAEASDAFGLSVAISGDEIIVGAPWNDDAADSAGLAYVFRRTGEVWSQEAKLAASNRGQDFFFGHSVSISGDYAAVGAFGEDSVGEHSGAAYAFQRHAGIWIHKTRMVASDNAAEDQFGQAVSVSGEFVIAGSPYDSDGGTHSGSAYVYDLGTPSANLTITVCGDGSGDFTDIQPAINAAVNGDTISVCDGTYTGAANRDLDFGGKAITVRSMNGPDNCTIDCQAGGRGFYFHSAEGPQSVVDGFTITHATAPPPSLFGGAFHCESSSPTIRNCRMVNNTCDGGPGINCQSASPTIADCLFAGNQAVGGGGGAIRFRESSPRISRCTIVGNYGATGGGIYSNRSNPIITECVIIGNDTRVGGGICSLLNTPIISRCIIAGNTCVVSAAGIYASSSDPVVVDCLVAGNSAAASGGSGIECYNASPTLVNNTVANNAIPGGAGIYSSGTGTPVLTNLIIWNNTPAQISGPAAVSYCDVQNGWPGTANLDVDPLFVAGPTGTWSVAATYNPATLQVTLTDASASWTPGQWIGKTVNPDLTQAKQFLVVSNTANSLTVWADWSTNSGGASWIPAGAAYQILDYRLQPQSGCVNKGNNTALPQDVTDFDNDGDTNEPIPFDLGDNARVHGCVVDLGAYELEMPDHIPGDFNDDCDVDEDDVSAFLSCMLGPTIPPYNPACANAKLDEDEDVDQVDVGLLQRCMTGPDVPGDPYCAND